MTIYARGRQIEWKARDELARAGYLVIRAAGSKSPVDLVAIGAGDVRLIQCKRTKRGNASSAVRDALKELQTIERPPYTCVEVWLWRDRKGFERITLY